MLFNKIKMTLLGMVLIFSSFQFSACSEDPIVAPPAKKQPTASFTWDPNGGYAPCAIQFTSTSQNAVDFTWDFGDGTSSIAENPSHTYNIPGTYTVTLKVKNGDLQNQRSAQITIQRPFSKANLTKVVVTKMPFLDAAGSGWDPFDGPDLFIQLLSPNPDNSVLVESGQVANLLSSQLPVTWNLSDPYSITNFTDFYFIQLMDFDAIDADDEIDYVSFKLDPYTTGTDAFPSTITKSQNGSTVTLHFNWTY